MKKMRFLALGLAAILSLSACAKTPEAPIVVQKNNDRLLEEATSEDENRQSLQTAQEESPKDYTFHYSSTDTKVKITAEADVLLPDTDSIPMYHLSSTGFTQEQVTAIYDYLFAGEETWYAKGNQYYTKSMADADLAEARAELSRLQTDTEMPSQSRDSWIKHIQEFIEYTEANYNNYPDSIDKIMADSTFRTGNMETISGSQEYRYLDVRTDSGKILSCMNLIDYGSADSSLTFRSATGERYNSDPTSTDWNNPVPYGSDVPFSCTYSYEDAKALADGLFHVAGVEVRLIQTELLQGYSNGSPEFSTQALLHDDTYSAFRFCYSRVIDGTSVAATTSSSLYLEDTNPTWLYERIYVTVDSNGISNVSWSYPVMLENIVNEDVQILPFSDISRIFEEMAPIIHQGKIAALDEESGAFYTTSITVDRVELNLMRIRDGGSLTGLYVPAWVFYGTEEYGTTRSSELSISMSPWIVLAINAVDGSVIDIKAGY